MKLKRFLSILLVLCCLLTLLPLGALPVSAVEPEPTMGSGTIAFQPNPLSDGLIDPSALDHAPSAPPIKAYGSAALVKEE